MLLRVQEVACICHDMSRVLAYARAVQVNNVWAGLSSISLFFNTDYIRALLMNILETNAQAVDEVMSFARCSQCVNTDS